MQVAACDFHVHFALNIGAMIEFEHVDHFGCALPFHGTLIFDQYLIVVALHHAQRDRGVFQNDPVKCFAFNQGLVGALCRFNDAGTKPARNTPAHHQQQAEQPDYPQKRPERVTEEALIADAVQAHPRVLTGGLELEAQAITIEAEAIAQVVYSAWLTQQHIAFG